MQIIVNKIPRISLCKSSHIFELSIRYRFPLQLPSLIKECLLFHLEMSIPLRCLCLEVKASIIFTRYVTYTPYSQVGWIISEYLCEAFSQVVNSKLRPASAVDRGPQGQYAKDTATPTVASSVQPNLQDNSNNTKEFSCSFLIL